MNFFCYTGHASKVSVNLLESTDNILEFYTVETRSLFDVFFKGVYSLSGRLVQTPYENDVQSSGCNVREGRSNGGLLKDKDLNKFTTVV